MDNYHSGRGLHSCLICIQDYGGFLSKQELNGESHFLNLCFVLEGVDFYEVQILPRTEVNI